MGARRETAEWAISQASVTGEGEGPVRYFVRTIGKLSGESLAEHRPPPLLSAAAGYWAHALSIQIHPFPTKAPRPQPEMISGFCGYVVRSSLPFDLAARPASPESPLLTSISAKRSIFLCLLNCYHCCEIAQSQSVSPSPPIATALP